jgi:hypothetical protein
MRLRFLLLFIGLSFMIGCNTYESKLTIDPLVAEEVASKIDTLASINDFRNKKGGDLKELINSDLRILIDSTGYFDVFSVGGVSINKEREINISYKLAESAGPAFKIFISNSGNIVSAKFKIAGDDSPSSNEIDLKIKELRFNKNPKIGDPLCFCIEFEAENWRLADIEPKNTHMRILGFVNDVGEESIDR